MTSTPLSGSKSFAATRISSLSYKHAVIFEFAKMRFCCETTRSPFGKFEANAFCLKLPYILSGAGGGAINFHETVKFGICSTLCWIAPLKREKHVGAIALIGNGIILMLHNFICTYPADQNTRSICISCD